MEADNVSDPEKHVFTSRDVTPPPIIGDFGKGYGNFLMGPGAKSDYDNCFVIGNTESTAHNQIIIGSSKKGRFESFVIGGVEIYELVEEIKELREMVKRQTKMIEILWSTSGMARFCGDV